MHVKNVLAMGMEGMDIVIGSKCITCDRRYGDADGHCYRIEVVMYVIDVM